MRSIGLILFHGRGPSRQEGARSLSFRTMDSTRAKGWMSIIVVPVSTSESQLKRGMTTVFVPAGAAGLAKASVLVCHQVTTLDRKKLSKKIGVLPYDLLLELEDALKAAMDLN